MVKFAQQLQNEMVPEWQDAYCSYADLKQDLKRIKLQRIIGPTFTRTGSLGLLKSLASFKHLSGPLSGPLSHGPRSGRRDQNMISFSPQGQSKDTLLVCMPPSLHPLSIGFCVACVTREMTDSSLL